MPRLALLLGQLGIAEIEPDPEFLRRDRTAAGSPAFGISRSKKRSISCWSVIHQRGKNVVSASSGKTTNRAPSPCASRNSAHQPLDDRLAAVGEMYRAQLGDGGAQLARHRLSPSECVPDYTTGSRRVEFPGCREIMPRAAGLWLDWPVFTSAGNGLRGETAKIPVRRSREVCRSEQRDFRAEERTPGRINGTRHFSASMYHGERARTELRRFWRQ